MVFRNSGLTIATLFVIALSLAYHRFAPTFGAGASLPAQF